MAKKGGAKAPPTYEHHTLTSDQRQKVNTIIEQFGELTKDHVAIVLEHHHFDVDKALDSIIHDGGQEAKKNWLTMQNNQTKTNNRNKKRNKKKTKKDNGTITSTPAHCTDADDSSSLHSSNIDFDAEKESATKIDDCDQEENDQTENEPSSICSTLVDNPTGDEFSLSDTVVESEIPDSSVQTTSVPSLEERRNSVPDVDVIAAGDAPVCRNSDDRTVASGSPREKTDEQSQHPPQKFYHKQRHSSSHMTKSLSEDFSSDQSSSTQRKGVGYTKCKKDLSRQLTSLPRIQSQLDNHLEDASKCMKNAFAEVRKMLNDRQTLLEQEVEKVKSEAVSLMKSRQDLGAQLKLRSDKNLSDAEWNDLRTDIKQFVTERKYDDELGKTLWFQYSIEAITEEVGRFGEVFPVKNAYSQRQHLRALSSTEPSSPISVVGSDDVPSTPSYTGDAAAAINDTTKDTDEPKIEKDIPIKSTGPTENRSRVFKNSSKRYNNNFQPNYGGRHMNHRGRGFHQRGAGQMNNNYVPRGRTYEYRQFGGNNEHRHHYTHSDRTEFHPPPSDDKLPCDVPVNASENNARYPFVPRDSQSHRGQEQRPYRRARYNQHYNNYNRPRGGRPPRYNNAENVSSGADKNVDNNANYDRETSQESKDMMNGY